MRGNRLLRLLHSERVIYRLTDSLAEIAQPSTRISAVHHAADEAQPFGGICAVSANIILGSSGILADPQFVVPGAGVDVRRMPMFGNLNDDTALQLEDILGTK